MKQRKEIAKNTRRSGRDLATWNDKKTERFRKSVQFEMGERENRTQTLIW